MREFTGFDYLLIDAANNHDGGLDKLTFEDRIDWGLKHLDVLEVEAEGRHWKERPMYLKAVSAIRKAQQGIPTGHLVGFDAVCSGMQIMSAATGCIDGARATGLVDPDRRADAYTDGTNIMNAFLVKPLANLRDDMKQAIMTALYGSKKEPEAVFGEDTEELQIFWKALWKLAPGACELLEALLASWQPYALAHTWYLPDGCVSHVKHTEVYEDRIEVDELGHTTFTYQWKENCGVKWEKKNAANVVHSLDAYVLRSLVRRCNYDRELIEWAEQRCTQELLQRQLDPTQSPVCPDEQLQKYLERYDSSRMADVVIVNHLYDDSWQFLSTAHLKGLQQILQSMLAHKPFEIITVHDDFKCHANNMNDLRKHYRDILAEIADSEVLSDILGQLHGTQGKWVKKSTTLSGIIRRSQYALC